MGEFGVMIIMDQQEIDKERIWMKKAMLAVLAGTMMVLALTACGSQGDPSGSFPEESGTQTTVSQAITSEPVGRIDEAACIAICQAYLQEDELEPETMETIKNWDDPDITMVESLPDFYYKIADATVPAPYYHVVFTTTADALLGSVDFYVDAAGTILGQNYRE